MPKTQKTPTSTDQTHYNNSGAGKKGIALTPPLYNIDAADRKRAVGTNDSQLSLLLNMGAVPPMSKDNSSNNSPSPALREYVDEPKRKKKPDIQDWIDETAEREPQRSASAFTRSEPTPPIQINSPAQIAREEDDDDPDHPTPTPSPRDDNPDVELEPLTDWVLTIDAWDPSTFWTPPGTTREQIALRLYNDKNHFGGFDIIEDKHVRLRNFDGVASEVVSAMRKALDVRLQRDTDKVIGILQQKRINDNDEWILLDITTWWSSKGDLTNVLNRSYFDAYLDTLDTHQLTGWGLFSDTTRTALEWLLIEAGGKQDAIYPLIGKRSSRGTAHYVRTGDEVTDSGRVTGSITAPTGKREFWSHFAIGAGGVSAEKQIVDESSAARAEIALRNSSHREPRVMIPGGNGRFYGYTIRWPRLQGQGADATTLPFKDPLWYYPGTIFIQGDEYQPNFGRGGEAEHQQRSEILTQALASGINSLRGLDFDVLAMMTFDQRITALGLAIGSDEVADASLVARILYSIPNAEFPRLERRLSTNGMMKRMATLSGPPGMLAMIGRIFTVKAVESMQVAGENLESLPEIHVGRDENGFHHYGVTTTGNIVSRVIPATDFQPEEPVEIGRERAAGGETPGTFNRTVLHIQPYIFRGSDKNAAGLLVDVGRNMASTLFVADGPVQGPFLPTQLVRVKVLGPSSQTRIVTALEAAGLAVSPDAAMYQILMETTFKGGVQLMAGLGLARAFGPALAEGLAEGGGARAIARAVGEAATTEVGHAALVNASLLGSMELVDQHRAALEQTSDGRTFLELYDVTMMIWIAHDLDRLIFSGLLPRLAVAADKIIALPGVLREALLPIRQEIEAMWRAIVRFETPAGFQETATTKGLTMGSARESRPGFMAMLRVTRGEVAAERATEKLAGTSAQAVGRRVFNRLGGLVERTEKAVTDTASGNVERAELEMAAEKAAAARLAVAQRVGELRPDARETFLEAVDGVMAARPNSLESLADLLTAAAESRQPNVFILEVQKLVNRRAISDEALSVLGQKARKSARTLDLAWLNRTSISDETLDFLARDKRTNWDLYRRAVTEPTGEVMKAFRISARGAGAEMVAEDYAEQLGTNVRRQVEMGSSEIDYEVTVAGRRRGFEIKGWIEDTWNEALDAAIKRLNHRGLTAEERKVVKKIDSMLKQLKNAHTATRQAPYLGFTDALSPESQDKLRRILTANGLGGTEFVPMSEAKITEAAQGTIGEALGVPRP